MIFSSGIHNRYGHPHPLVVERYARRKVEMLYTAIHGAVTFYLMPEQVIQDPNTYLQQSKRYWHSTRKQL